MKPDSISILKLSAVEAAPLLLGWTLCRRLPKGVVKAKIVETEAYHQADPASHSYRGLTRRTWPMFEAGGRLYVYFTYGMHYCMNIVVGKKGEGEGVLLRAAEPLEGIEIMIRNRYGTEPSQLDAVQGSQEEQASRIGHTVSEATDAADAAMRQKPAGAAGSAGRQGEVVRGLCNGPGKLAQAFGVKDTKLSGKILDESSIWLEPSDKPVAKSQIIIGPRIGISTAVGELARFYVKDNPFVSRR